MFLCFLIFFGLLAHRKSSDLLGCRYVPVHRKGSWEATEAQPATRSAGKARELEEVYLTLSRYLLNGYVHYAWTYTYYILLLYIYIIRIAYVYIIIYTIYTCIYIFGTARRSPKWDRESAFLLFFYQVVHAVPFLGPCLSSFFEVFGIRVAEAQSFGCN
jgi:hypothetical protein